ncbi:alpha/beta hydrolase [Gordonia sp. HY285]|uniref:alpha/beta hydrolase n=1 Tax=Gordonia liuliyuniae TaxID=2911517 RepID=UPI001F41688D|nr:alpha/beta hydrolase [Gordonia liuliyuniae]MCF8610283.1 alpha/beta hydrolase [Gordonia liuliyuniae]
MTAQPRRIVATPGPGRPKRRALTSRPTVAVGAVAVAAGLIGAGVCTTQAFADPEQAAGETARGGQTAGSVFASRPIADDSLVTGAANGQQYSFWTQGSDDRTHLTTAVVLTPKGKAPAAGWPVVAYAHDADGVSEDCGPTQARVARDTGAVSDLLREDYAVVVPDYSVIGTDGSPQYVDYSVAAKGVTDAVRAALDVEPSLSSRWAAVGDGQGAAVAVDLARTASKSGSAKLDFRGATATTLPVGYADVVTGLSPQSAKVSPSTVADVVYTLSSLPSDEIAPLLSTRGRELVTKAKKLCEPALTKAVGSSNVADLVRKPISSERTLTSDLRTQLALPSSGFSRPIMLSQKLVDDDTDVPASLQYLTTAQLASNKVSAKTYLTGDVKDADHQEKTALTAFLKKLF